jgi:hypothetical protein
VSTDTTTEVNSALAHASMQLEHTREQFVVSMGALEAEVARSLDWRQWVRRKPGLVVCLAFGLGLFLGHRS